jgi:hypothetical protein
MFRQRKKMEKSKNKREREREKGGGGKRGVRPSLIAAAHSCLRSYRPGFPNPSSNRSYQLKQLSPSSRRTQCQQNRCRCHHLSPSLLPLSPFLPSLRGWRQGPSQWRLGTWVNEVATTGEGIRSCSIFQPTHLH